MAVETDTIDFPPPRRPLAAARTEARARGRLRGGLPVFAARSGEKKTSLVGEKTDGSPRRLALIR